MLIAVGCVHIALHMFQDNGSGGISPPPPSEQAVVIDVPPEQDSADDRTRNWAR